MAQEYLHPYHFDYDQVWHSMLQPPDSITSEKIMTTCKQVAHIADSMGNRPELIKAKCWRYTLEQYNDAEPTDVLFKLEKEILLAPDNIEKAIWSHIAAKAYERYAKENKKQLYQRAILKDTVHEDIRTWDMNTIQKKIRTLYLASVQYISCAKDMPYTQFAAIITPGINTATLRHTLFELLAADAIDFLSKSHEYTSDARIPFDRYDSRYLLPATDFIQIAIPSGDSSNPIHQCLHLYQDLLRQCVQEGQVNAFIDFELARLQYMRQISHVNQLDSIYCNSLQQLIVSYPAASGIAQAKYLLWSNRYTDRHKDYRSSTSPSERYTLIALHDSLADIPIHHPGTEGAINAANLVNQIEQQYIGIDMEEVNIPDKPIKALVSYQNRNEIKISVYRIHARQYAQKDTNSMQMLYAFQQELPNATDFSRHSIEISIGTCPPGFYALALTGGEQPVIHFFQVNNILPVNRQRQYLLLHRETGFPLEGVRVLYTQDSTTRNYTVMGSSKQNGSMLFPKNKLPQRSHPKDYYSFVYKHDTLILFDKEMDFPSEHTYSTRKKEDLTHFLFTDRSIYRPGQTIWFKGIVFKNKKNSLPQTVSGESVTVTFDDVSGNTIEELTLRTNSFGSFTGSFTVPETGLLGEMDIYTDEAEVDINVEDYKRPKFYIVYDTLKQQVYVNDTVIIRGRALAFAGNPIDGATVRYTVRQLQQSSKYHRMRSYDEIFDSVTTTDKNGYFECSFVAEPENTVADDDLSVYYQYEVRAEVIDKNGESRSKTTTVKAGYTNVYLNCYIPQIVKTDMPLKFFTGTHSINNTFIPSTIQVTIKQLKPADRIYRRRLWEAPTDSFLNRETYHHLFPNDTYGAELELQNRPFIATVFDSSFVTMKDSPLIINTAIFRKSGYYRVEVHTIDLRGKKISDQMYTFVLNLEHPQQFDKPVIALHPNGPFYPGDTVTASLYTAVADAYILQANSFNRTYDLTKGNIIRQPIRESDRGRQDFHWMFVRNGRVYKYNDYIYVPWDNKQLNIKMTKIRNILRPGNTEEWTVAIERADHKKVNTEVLAVMYDAALDELQPHEWNFSPLYYTSKPYRAKWSTTSISHRLSAGYINPPTKLSYPKRYPFIKKISTQSGNYTIFPSDSVETLEEVHVYGTRVDKRTYTGSISTITEMLPVEQSQQDLPPLKPLPPEQTRTDFKETAFFIPQLRTDKQGQASFRFTVPESLTEWKMMLFAHTKDAAIGYKAYTVQTQKELMVAPNLPRILRQGDEIHVTARISNLSNTIQQGKASITITDATTGQNLNAAFSLRQSDQEFSANAQQSTLVSFHIIVPESIQTAVYIQINATTSEYGDGEKHLLPVLPNRLLITETMPVTVSAQDPQQEFTFNAFVQNQDTGISHQQLTVEYNTNPYWSGIWALPYLMEFPYSCTEQKFNKLFATVLAGNILHNNPQVASAVHQWTLSTDETSPLYQNTELKSTLLSETPWQISPKTGQEQKKQLAHLLNQKKMSVLLAQLIDELQELQSAKGAFPWFKGMQDNVFVTQYILTGLARLSELKATLPKPYTIKSITKKGLSFLDQYHTNRYFNNLQQPLLNAAAIQYLYVRSLYPETPATDSTRKMVQAYAQEARQHWFEYSNYLQAMIAIASYHNRDTITARSIIASLSVRASHSPEMGMYWRYTQGTQWYEDPIATQAFLIKTYETISGDTSAITAMRTWLLRKKQTQHWGTTIATAEACYALLSSDKQVLQDPPPLKLTLGNVVLNAPDKQTGYLKQTFQASDIKPEMGHLSINREQATSNPGSISWGAVYWQYYSNMNTVRKGTDTAPLSIDKRIYRILPAKSGQTLQLLNADEELSVGDQVMIRFVIHADRDMDYIHLKDLRATGFEPAAHLSGYRYQDDIGYYESTRDAATDFFFDQIPKGTWVISYPQIVNQRGCFNSGLATIQCMYAPEFTNHSHTRMLKVK